MNTTNGMAGSNTEAWAIEAGTRMADCWCEHIERTKTWEAPNAAEWFAIECDISNGCDLYDRQSTTRADKLSLSELELQLQKGPLSTVFEPFEQAFALQVAVNAEAGLPRVPRDAPYV